jgi:hypothetical protein
MFYLRLRYSLVMLGLSRYADKAYPPYPSLLLSRAMLVTLYYPNVPAIEVKRDVIVHLYKYLFLTEL